MSKNYIRSISKRHEQPHRHRTGDNCNDNGGNNSAYVYARCLTSVVSLKTSNHCPLFAGAPDNQGLWVEIGSNIQCDISAGEKYLKSSPQKVPSIWQCKRSCQASVGCQSITYFQYLNNGWCSHFSTPCTKHKKNTKAVSMRLDINAASTSTPGRFRLVVIRFGCCALDHVVFLNPS